MWDKKGIGITRIVEPFVRGEIEGELTAEIVAYLKNVCLGAGQSPNDQIERDFETLLCAIRSPGALREICRATLRSEENPEDRNALPIADEVRNLIWRTINEEYRVQRNSGQRFYSYAEEVRLANAAPVAAAAPIPASVQPIASAPVPAPVFVPAQPSSYLGNNYRAGTVNESSVYEPQLFNDAGCKVGFFEARAYPSITIKTQGSFAENMRKFVKAYAGFEALKQKSANEDINHGFVSPFTNERLMVRDGQEYRNLEMLFKGEQCYVLINLIPNAFRHHRIPFIQFSAEAVKVFSNDTHAWKLRDVLSPILNNIDHPVLATGLTKENYTEACRLIKSVNEGWEWLQIHLLQNLMETDPKKWSDSEYNFANELTQAYGELAFTEASNQRNYANIWQASSSAHALQFALITSRLAYAIFEREENLEYAILFYKMSNDILKGRYEAHGPASKGISGSGYHNVQFEKTDTAYRRNLKLWEKNLEMMIHMIADSDNQDSIRKDIPRLQAELSEAREKLAAASKMSVKPPASVSAAPNIPSSSISSSSSAGAAQSRNTVFGNPAAPAVIHPDELKRALEAVSKSYR